MPDPLSWISSYGCTSAAGRSASTFWRSLSTGVVPTSTQWPSALEFRSSREHLSEQLQIAWKETWGLLSPTAQTRIRDGRTVGVILASTKGCIDDMIWEQDPDLSRDTLSPLIDDFLKANELAPARRTCVSNACTSGLSALFLARHWLRHAGLTDVIVISADTAGAFVQKGFAALRVLTPDQTRPFSAARSGFKLGDASACLVLSNARDENSLFLAGVSVDAEGHAVTRPSQSGESLEAACRNLPLETSRPDLVIAHGTSTQINDAIEDRVYARLFSAATAYCEAPLITATKWATGHTLGASSAMDVIAACEALKHNSAFAIATTSESDASFQNRYAAQGSDLRITASKLQRVMVSSLGFGGIHAAALIEKPT